VAKRLESRGPILTKREVQKAYEELLGHDEYLKTVVKSTGDEANVKKRIKMATDAFSKVT
jgi:hypothetical protein